MWRNAIFKSVWGQVCRPERERLASQTGLKTGIG